MTRDPIHPVRCSCGWTGKRVLSGITQPCPRCGKEPKEIKP